MPTDRQSSRGFTLHAALERLNLLAVAASPQLIIHVIGADSREGCSALESASVFAGLCARLVGSPCCDVHILLCGPNCPTAAEGQGTPVTNGPRLRISYSCLAYEDWHAANQGAPPPHLAVAFNAGAWGYDSWRPCIELVARTACPFLLTSYNALEAEEDEDALSSWGVVNWRWHAEANPFASDEAEVRQGSIPHPLHENGAWMCFSGPLAAQPANEKGVVGAADESDTAQPS